MKLNSFLAAALFIPTIALAQVRPTAPVAGALVFKKIPVAKMSAQAESSISSAPSYQGIQCADGCVVAKGERDKAGINIRFGDGSVKVEEVRTGLMISHDKPHTLKVVLDEAQLAGVQCDAHGTLTVTPYFRAMGATRRGFKWAIFKGATQVTGGHSNGEAVKWNGDGHTKGPMQVAIFSDATVEVNHDGMRLVMTSDDSQAIESRSGAQLSFNELRLTALGVNELALVSAQIQGVNR